MLPKDDRLFRQDLLAHQPAAGPDDAPVRNGHVGRNVAFALEHVPFANFERLDGATDLEDVVRPDDQRLDRPVQHVLVRFVALRDAVHDRGVLFDDAVLTDYDRARLGDDGRTGMDQTPAGDGDVASEVAVLAHHRAGHYFDAGSERRMDYGLLFELKRIIITYSFLRFIVE